jgi:hypothetical protein
MEKWQYYFGSEETVERLLSFFAQKEENLIAGNKFQYFWGNDNAEWRFLSLASDQNLIGTIMKVSDSGIWGSDQPIAKFSIYYVKNPTCISCGTLKKPMFREFRNAMSNNGKRSYGKVWLLYPSGELAKLEDIIKLIKGSIKELPKEIELPLLHDIADRNTLRKNGFYLPTLKGGLRIAAKGDDLYIYEGNKYKKIEVSEKTLGKLHKTLSHS